ncbi:MAG: hypothetical protein VB076_05135 [Synergistaceae bacterium]|nr:hypothetical protein [Synergistaceae bacterium]
MAKGKEFPLFVIMKAVDKATAPLRALGHTAVNTAKPFQKLRELNNRMRLAAEAGGLGKITNAARNLGGAVSGAVKKTLTLGTAMASIAMLGGGFLFKITKQTAEYGDKVWKTSQKIGIGVEEWQELAHAGEMSGIEQDALSTGLVRLNKNIVEAANGNKTMTAWFQRAGISIKDAEGKVKSADQVLMEMAEIFGKMPDGAKKTAVAVALAGRSGADLIPMLNSGKKGLSDMRQEARDLNLVLKKEITQGAEKFLDNISRMGKAIGGIVFYVGSLLIPVFDDIVKSITKWVVANRELIQDKLQHWVNSLRKSLPELKKHFLNAAEKMKVFFEKVSAGLELVGGFEGIFKAFGLYIAGSFIASLAVAANAFIALGTAIMTTPVGWIMAAIAAIAVAAVLIYKNWDKVSAALKAFGHAIFTPLRLFGELIDYLTSFDLFDIGAKIFTSLWDGMKSVFAKIKDWFGGIKKLIPDFLLPGSNININPPGQNPQARVTPAAGVIQQNQMATQKSAAEVKVEFANLPKGTTVKTQKNNGVDMDLNMGYAMATS